MRRVLVIGSGGAGKSTFARDLARRLGVPIIHLDAFYWHAGWVATPDDEWRRVVVELTRREAWVMDGNFGGTLDLRLAACDTAVFLDAPRLVCLWRVLKRWMSHRGRARADIAEGCPERLNFEFMRWIWTYPARHRREILMKLHEIETSSGKLVVILDSERSRRTFLASASAHPGDGPTTRSRP